VKPSIIGIVAALGVLQSSAWLSRVLEVNMEQPALAERVDSLLHELDRVEPVSFDLGTPELLEVDAVHELVDIGSEIVPLLLDRIQRNAPKKRTAYIVVVLNRIGDIRALAPLLDLRARYRARETKDEWDHAVIGQSNLAIEQLEKQVR
jgi:hypothetical protein